MNFNRECESVRVGFPAVRTDGRRAVGVRSRDYQIFWDGLIYLVMGPRPRARFARAWSSAITGKYPSWSIPNCFIKWILYTFAITLRAEPYGQII